MRAIKSFGKSSEPVVGLIELLTLKTKDDFRAKYSSIGDRLSELLKHGDPHQISLCFAAATRFFLRAKCQPLASYCLATYRHICLQSSGQTTNDSFGFFSEKLPTYKLPSSIAPLSRAIEYGGLTYDLVKYFGRERFRTLLTSSERQRRLKDADQEALYGIICGYLSQFKGPVLKFGQIFGSFTSDEATSKFFGALTDRNTPMDFATVSNVVQNAYGTRLNSVFREFNEQPLGVGSIGQVHQARLMNGSTVAVKVKFPKIEEAIKFDLFILRQLSPLMRVMRPNLCYNAILKEVELQFLGECNFEEEARRQHLLRCSYGGDLKIPEAFMGLSRRSVLVSELVGGRDFFSFLSESSQAERDRAGAAIVRFVVSCCRDGFFNSDPNTGNFKFTDQGVYALDFGGSKLWGDAHRRLWSDIIVAGIDKDRQLFQKTIKEMGIPGSMARFDYDAAYQQMIETGIMGYIAEDCVRSIPLELVLNDIKKMTLPDRLSGKYRNIPADFVMGFRIYFGHVALVAKLGARANWSNIVRSVMSEQLLPKGTRCKSYGMF
jgi:predicted unusual protein kinase regulating ubiquinone biosynthesis (AarF/ABC1/UbiB family)